jgi:branched-chain amino acid transport system ATP-binding protein
MTPGTGYALGAMVCYGLGDFIFKRSAASGVARDLLLDPKLILIDEPSIGLSPLMVQEVFAILKDLRDMGVSILLIEQNAKQALQMSNFGLVLEQGQTRIEDTASRILSDPRIAQLFLGGGLAPVEPVS